MKLVAVLLFVAFLAHVNCFEKPDDYEPVAKQAAPEGYKPEPQVSGGGQHYQPQPQNPHGGAGGFGASFQKMGSAVGKTAVSDPEMMCFFEIAPILLFFFQDDTIGSFINGVQNFFSGGFIHWTQY